jgi:hypothetical protein
LLDGDCVGVFWQILEKKMIFYDARREMNDKQGVGEGEVRGAEGSVRRGGRTPRCCR